MTTLEAIDEEAMNMQTLLGVHWYRNKRVNHMFNGRYVTQDGADFGSLDTAIAYIDASADAEDFDTRAFGRSFPMRDAAEWPPSRNADAGNIFWPVAGLLVGLLVGLVF